MNRVVVRIEPPRRRSSVRRAGADLEIEIPAKRNALVWLFLTAWLGGWAFGEVMVARELFSGGPGPDLFLIFWLSAWTLGGGLALYAWAWMLRGREIITLRPGVIATKRDVLGLGRVREYDLSHVRNLRVSPDPASLWDWSGAMRFWGLSGGPIAFDYGAGTFRFGGGVDEAEAREIVDELRAAHRFPE